MVSLQSLLVHSVKCVKNIYSGVEECSLYLDNRSIVQKATKTNLAVVYL
jgi:hypothetical protein